MYINKAIKGYKNDYQYILALISFINMPIQLEGMEYIQQRLLNYGNTDYLHLGR